MGFSPQKFGKFMLLEKIASGGMAEIFMAQTIGPGGFEKIVALKRILPSYSANQEFISMFINEAKTTSQLTHSNIVQIHDFGKHDNNYYLAMELVEGRNLRQILARAEGLKRIIPIEHAAYMVMKVCLALDYAHRFRDKRAGHAMQIIHRDISPQNILLSYEGEIKLVDFGIAKTREQKGKTKSGVLKGKFGYMSPEQANGESIDQRSDIFSTGIILFEMLTRQRLFMSNNDLNTLKKIQEAKIPVPSHFNPDIPFELEEIVMKALQKNPDKRYQNAADFHKDLSRFLNTLNPDFTASHVSSFVRSLFAMEILEHKKHMNDILAALSQIDRSNPIDKIDIPHSEMQSDVDTSKQIKTKSQTLSPGQFDQTEETKTDIGLTGTSTSEENYPKKVRLQLMAMGLTVVMLCFLLLQFNKNPDRIIQSIFKIGDTPQPEAQTVPIKEQDSLKAAVNALDVKPTAVLRVDSLPQGADVYIDDVYVGQTPLVTPSQPKNRELKLKLLHLDFLPEHETIIITSDALNVTKELMALGFGYLNIKTEPQSVIYIDDKRLGSTPVLKLQLATGMHKVKAINDEFSLIAEAEIEVKADEVKLIDENTLIFRPIPE